MRFRLGCAAVLALTLVSSAASASMCPVLIKQGRDAEMNQNGANVKNALAKLDRAAALHKEGKHADSMREANEALGMLGVKK
jgi:hypothetical protein